MLRVGNEMPKPLKMMKVQEGNQWVERAEFRLSFYGVKAEMTSSKVAIRQSQTDRKTIAYEPMKLTCKQSNVTTKTVEKLQFSEATKNNMRKNGNPHPEQKYLNLVVNLQAVTKDGQIYTVMSYVSDKVIVRAGNPSAFSSVETSEDIWQKRPAAYGPNHIYYNGSVSIGTETSLGDPSQIPSSLTLAGDFIHHGNSFKPSDKKFKTNIEQKNTRKALENVSQLEIVEFDFIPEYREQWNLKHDETHKTGVIAQDVQKIIPDAVRQHGHYLAVDESPLLYESIAAVQEIIKRDHSTHKMIKKLHADGKNVKKRLKLADIPSIKSSDSLNESSVNYSTSCLSSSLSSLASRNLKSGSENKRRQFDDHRLIDTANLITNNLIFNYAMQMGRGYALNCNIFVALICCCCAISALLFIIAFGLLAWLMARKSHGPETQISTMHLENSSLYPAAGLGPGQIVDVNDPDEDGGWNPPNWPGGAPASLFSYASDSGFYCCPNCIIKYNSDVAPQSQIDFQPLEDNSHVADRVKRRGIGPIDMHILDVNHTIGRDYCTSRACNDHKGGNYTIHVPISEHMPLMSLQLAFDVPEGSTVSFCGDDLKDDWKCIAPIGGWVPIPTNVPESFVHTANQVFYLPVGFYVRSEYRFRIGSTTACTAELSDVGHTYEEYNVVFYRVLSSNYCTECNVDGT